MFGLGVMEISIILVVALLVLGPKRLPDAARSLGRSLAEFRRASNEIRNALVLEGSAQPGPPMGNHASDSDRSRPRRSDESGTGSSSGGTGPEGDSATRGAKQTPSEPGDVIDTSPIASEYQRKTPPAPDPSAHDASERSSAAPSTPGSGTPGRE